METTLQIGEFAAAIGVNPKTIRFYEEVGVLPPARRSEQGWRLYGPEDVTRLRFVRGSRAIGLGLDEIRNFLALRDQGESACSHVLDSIKEQIEEVDRRLEELGQLRVDLEHLHAEGSVRPIDRDDMSGCVCELVGTRAK